MAKSVEYGIRKPKEESKSAKKEKAIMFGVRSISSDFERRVAEVNTPPSNANYRAKGSKKV